MAQRCRAAEDLASSLGSLEGARAAFSFPHFLPRPTARPRAAPASTRFLLVTSWRAGGGTSSSAPRDPRPAAASVTRPLLPGARPRAVSRHAGSLAGAGHAAPGSPPARPLLSHPTPTPRARALPLPPGPRAPRPRPEAPARSRAGRGPTFLPAGLRERQVEAAGTPSPCLPLGGVSRQNALWRAENVCPRPLEFPFQVKNKKMHLEFAWSPLRV